MATAGVAAADSAMRRSVTVPVENDLLVLALAAVALLAAGRGSSPSAGNNLELYNDKAARTPFYEQLGVQAKQQAGVGINPVGYADEPTYRAFVKSALKTKAKPDLFTWATGPLLSQLVRSGDVAATGALWRKAIRQGDLPQGLEQYHGHIAVAVDTAPRQ